MSGVNKTVGFATKDTEQLFLAVIWESFTGKLWAEKNVYSGVRPAFISELMVGIVVSRNKVEINCLKKMLEEDVTFV